MCNEFSYLISIQLQVHQAFSTSINMKNSVFCLTYTYYILTANLLAGISQFDGQLNAAFVFPGRGLTHHSHCWYYALMNQIAPQVN